MLGLQVSLGSVGIIDVQMPINCFVPIDPRVICYYDILSCRGTNWYSAGCASSLFSASFDTTHPFRYFKLDCSRRTIENHHSSRSDIFAIVIRMKVSKLRKYTQ